MASFIFYNIINFSLFMPVQHDISCEFGIINQKNPVTVYMPFFKAIK